MRKTILVMISALLLAFFGCDKKSTDSDLLDGEKLVQERCTSCHGLDTIYDVTKNRADWEVTVDEMINKGAQLTEAERQAVIDYLSSL